MNQPSVRRRLRSVSAVTAALAASLAFAAPASAEAGDQTLPNGLIKTAEHTGFKEIAPTRASRDFTASASNRISNFRQQEQKYNQWCWAATGASIEQALGSNTSQESFCAAGKGTSPSNCPNRPAQIYEIVQGFRGTGFDAQDAGGRISFTSVTRQIDAGIPNLTGIYWTSGGGHAQVIYGYDTSNQSIMVADPWPSSQRYQTWSFNQYASNSQHSWNDTIVNIAKR